MYEEQSLTSGSTSLLDQRPSTQACDDVDSSVGVSVGDAVREVYVGVRCTELVATVRSSLTELAGLVAQGGLRDLSDPAVAELAVELTRVADAAAAVNASALARVDRSGVVRGQGYVSTSSWLRDQTRLDHRSAREQIRNARLLTDTYTSTHDAWLAGAITGAHASTLVRGVHTAMKAVEPKLRADARRQSEAALIEIARDYSADHVAAATKRIRAAVDPDGMHAIARELDGREFFKLTPVADGYAASGWFNQINGTKLATILEGRRNTKYHTGQNPDGHQHPAAERDDAFVRDEAGDPIYADEQSARRIYEQNAVIMSEIADELLTGGYAGVISGERPHVEITITLDDLHNQTGYGELTLMGASHPSRLSPILTSDARELSCDAQIRRVILAEPDLLTQASPVEPDELVDFDDWYGWDPPDPEHQHDARQSRQRLIRRLLNAPSEIIEYGRQERIVPPGLRRVLARRDGGCIYPGCTRPPQHTHAHHVQHWADCGDTNLANLASLCNTHHHTIHAQAIAITPTPNKQPNQPGYWTITPQ
jgi:hypothetical protein